MPARVSLRKMSITSNVPCTVWRHRHGAIKEVKVARERVYDPRALALGLPHIVHPPLCVGLNHF